MPFAAIVLLMGIGLVLQLRLELYSSSLSMGSLTQVEIDRFQGDWTIQTVPGKMIALFAAYCLSVLALVGAVLAFSGNRFKNLGRKYMVLYSGTILMLGIFTGMSLIFDGGRFLFSRVPWELAKISLPLAFAGYFADNGRLMSLTNNGRLSFNAFGWGPFLVMLCLPMMLFVILGDFGQVMIYGVVMLLMLFVATESFLYPVMGALVFVFIQVTAGLYSHYFPEHIAVRFTLWLDFWAGFPSVEWWDRSYQTANAFFAFRAGGLEGTGLGLGYPHLVPLVRSDFIFAEAAEELGFIGTLGIFLLYLSIVITGFRTAFSCSDRFGFLAVSALTFVFSCQIIINVGGVLNIMPLTGIVLPFLSKGGFALITFAFLVGLLMAASHRNALVSK